MSSLVAHDFNNLPTAVLGNLEIMELQLADEELPSRLRSARAAAERGAELTHQLLTFSRKQHLAPKPVDLSRLLGQAGDILLRTSAQLKFLYEVLFVGAGAIGV